MFDIPEEFRNIPEAARLRRAEAEFLKAIEQERHVIGQTDERAQRISEQARRAHAELMEVQHAFDSTTGEPQPVGLTPALIAGIERQFPTSQHEEVTHLLDRSCGRTLPFFREATAEKLEHLRLCALKVGAGDLARLRRAVELANRDWRDLIMAANCK
jgi:hypothetical protein